MANKYTKTAIPPKDELENLYHTEQKTQSEIGVLYNVSQKVVWRWFRDIKIKSRIPFKRNQQRENNSSWKGDNVTYAALHYRVQSAMGKANKCEDCGKTEGVIEWANQSGDYHNTNDYKMMCRSYHHIFDGHINNFLNKRKRPLINKRKLIDEQSKEYCRRSEAA